MEFYKTYMFSRTTKCFVLVFVFIGAFIANFGVYLKTFQINVSDKKSRRHRNPMLEGLFQRIDKTPQETKLPSFLKNFKNPCWIERNINDTKTRIRCLPYFYLVGMPKCGTSDFYNRITQHPSISNKSRKETHWFSRRGFSRNGNYKLLTNYLQLYDHVVTEDVLKSKQTNGRHNGIFGDFSGTYWDSKKLLMNWNDKKGKEAIPPFTISDVIHKLNPASKILFLLRNPVQRIYSDYLYFGKGKVKGASDFHAKIKAAIQRHWYCLKKHCLRYCTYFSVYQGVRLEVSIYRVYVEDYLRSFPRGQVKIIKTENFSANMEAVITDVFRFLDIESPNGNIMTAILSLRRGNVNTKKYALVGPMLPETKTILSDFYRKHNENLSKLLGENMTYD